MIEVCRDLNELHPKVKELAEKLLEACKNQGLNIKIGETYRSVERQEYLYAQGRTRPGSIVTNARGSSMSSYHQWRLAFDVFQNIKGDEYNSIILAKVGAIGQKLGLEWGGAWSSFQDTPHFQYTFGLSLQDLKAGKKPPEYKPTSSTSNESKPTQNTDTDYINAVKGLVSKNIINTETTWLPNPEINFAEALIQKIAVSLIEKDYNTKIDLLFEKGIISDVDKWKNKKYSETDIKWLIKKANQIL